MREKVQRDSINYFPPNAQPGVLDRFFADVDSRAMPWDKVELSDQRACLGRLYFPVPGGIPYGQHWLNVKFAKSVVRVPFRILTKDEDEMLEKNYHDIKKQIDKAFKPKKSTLAFKQGGDPVIRRLMFMVALGSAGRLGGVGPGAPGGAQRHRGLDVQRRRERGRERQFADSRRSEGRLLLGRPLGFNLSPNVELGFLFDMQKTDLEASGIVNVSVPQSIYNYHGYFAYNFGDTDAAARPYILGGLGAQTAASNTALGEIGGETQFSSTWAAGVKIFPGRNFGIRLEGRWTPTYIKTDSEGYWCDPWWGCYAVGDAEFSNQFELSGGIILRF